MQAKLCLRKREMGVPTSTLCGVFPVLDADHMPSQSVVIITVLETGLSAHFPLFRTFTATSGSFCFPDELNSRDSVNGSILPSLVFRYFPIVFW